MSEIGHQPAQLFFDGSSGLRIAADQAGPADGPTVLLLHGGGQTRHSWRRSAAAIAEEGFHVVWLDARGHGDSEWAPDRDYSLRTLVADVEAVIAQLAAPVILVGASLGGLTSLLVAHDLGPSVVSGLVLVDIVPRIEAAGGERVRDFMAERPDGFATLDEAAESISRYLPHRTRPASTGGLRRNLRQRADGRWHWHWDPAFMTPNSNEPNRLVDPVLLEAAARNVTVPTLLVRGVQSDVLSPQGAQELLALIPGSRLVDVAGAGHMVAGDDNDIFARAVIDFLSELPS
jgi:pimeloyl-ACP methyl ester carboxylesterase